MERMQYDPAAPREWSGLGNGQTINPQRQVGARSAFDADVSFAEKSHTHLWVVMITHRATDQMLDAFGDPDDSNMPILDADTLAQPPAVICWICTQPYEPRLRLRRCNGDKG